MDTDEMKEMIVGTWESYFDTVHGRTEIAFSDDGNAYQHVRVTGRGMAQPKNVRIEGTYTVEGDMLCIHWKELGTRNGEKFTWKEISSDVRRPIDFIDSFNLKVYGDDDAEIFQRTRIYLKKKDHHEVEIEELYRDSLDYSRYGDVADWRQKAFDCMLRAAEGGYKDAMVKVGAFYCKGQYVEKDYEKGIKWLKLAVEQGAKFAKIALDYHSRHRPK